MKERKRENFAQNKTRMKVNREVSSKQILILR